MTDAKATATRSRSPEEVRAADAVKACLGSGNVRLLMALETGPCGSDELSRRIGVSHPSVTHSLRILTTVGVTSCDRQGRRRINRLTPRGKYVLRALREFAAL